MKRIEAGAIMATEGLWMSNDEAFAVKRELRARGTKLADKLADALTFPEGTVARCDNERVFAELKTRIQHAIDVLLQPATSAEDYERIQARALCVLAYPEKAKEATK